MAPTKGGHNAGGNLHSACRNFSPSFSGNDTGEHITVHSFCGHAMLRSYLYEAANVLLTRVAKWSTLKAWGIRLANEAGCAKPRLRSPERRRGGDALAEHA